MRASAFALAISVATGWALTGPADAAARRVASLNLCTDELLLALAAPDQPVSVTHLSGRPLESPFWRQARRYHRNDGSLLSAMPQRPDLVLDMGGGARDSARIARRLGLEMLTLPFPQDIDDVERAIARVAIALDRREAGRTLLRRLARLRSRAPQRLVDAAWLGGGGRSLAATGLGAEWMALAGLRQQALPGDRLTLERLVAAPPDRLLVSDYRRDQYSLDRRWLAHPLVRRVGAVRSVVTDGRRWTCLGPLLIDEIARLRRIQG
jgi:iron complex transport system substrate-binding protein